MPSSQMNTEPFGQHKERILITHTAVAPTFFRQRYAILLLATTYVNTQLSGRARARMWTALAIQTDDSTPAAALGRRAHSHRAALSLAAFLVDEVGRHALGASRVVVRPLPCWSLTGARCLSGDLVARICGWFQLAHSGPRESIGEWLHSLFSLSSLALVANWQRPDTLCCLSL